jgi:ATP-dependent helicase HrpA
MYNVSSLVNPNLRQLDLAALQSMLPDVMTRDRHRLSMRLSGLLRRHAPGALERLAEEIRESHSRARQRRENAPKIEYPPDLPVAQKKDEIKQTIANNQIVVLCGETGSGKTTQLPKICLDLGRGIKGLIGHTQPRRIAARSVAQRIASELATPLGQAVGYKIRFGDKTSRDTYIKLMTDGILLAETQGDRYLENYDTLIIDEAHERSLNIDFLLGYVKQLLPKRPDLKVIITSATIDPQRFSKHFNDCPILEVSGRTYPVEVVYRPALQFEEAVDELESEITGTGTVVPHRFPRKNAETIVPVPVISEDYDPFQHLLDSVNEVLSHGPGDVLVFLPGEREIRECMDFLGERLKSKGSGVFDLQTKTPDPFVGDIELLPLFARLSSDEQQRIFAPHAKRRIVLATNVAETSLTVPGIRYVIDPGYARISRYSPRSKVQRLHVEAISQASANQRAGRCGRVSAGVCLRLYSKEDFESRPAYTDPEILRTNLAAVILQMKSLNLGEPQTFPFLEPPDTRQIRDGYNTLRELGAVDEQDRITQLGRDLSRLPTDPRIARMILEAHRENVVPEVLIIAAALTIPDPRDRPIDKQQQADEAQREFVDETSDFLTFLNIWNAFRDKAKHASNSQLRKWCREHFLSWARMREWMEVHRQFRGLVAERRSARRPRKAPRADARRFG